VNSILLHQRIAKHAVKTACFVLTCDKRLRIDAIFKAIGIFEVSFGEWVAVKETY
jgi:hypothetical protein